MAQPVVVVEVFVALRQRIHPLAQQLIHAVFDSLRIARIRQYRSHSIEQSDLLIGFADQQQPRIRSDLAAVKSNFHSTSSNASKQLFLNRTIWHRRHPVNLGLNTNNNGPHSRFADTPSKYAGSRRVLSWRLSNTLDTNFCVEALEEAIGRYGLPEIFNTDQGSQFTSGEFTDVLNTNRIQISMDGKGRWMDNVFVERLWWSLKYEDVYLRAYDSITEARRRIRDWFEFYNMQRRHQSLNRHTPDQAYWATLPTLELAA